MIYNNDNNINQAKTLDEENPKNENQSKDDIITKNADLVTNTIDLTQSDNQNYSNVKDINKSNEN